MDMARSLPAANFCQACTVRNRAICADLDDEEINLLNAIGRRKTLQPGEQLLWEGDEAVLVANVIDGVLKLSISTGASVSCIASWWAWRISPDVGAGHRPL